MLVSAFAGRELTLDGLCPRRQRTVPVLFIRRLHVGCLERSNDLAQYPRPPGPGARPPCGRVRPSSAAHRGLPAPQPEREGGAAERVSVRRAEAGATWTQTSRSTSAISTCSCTRDYVITVHEHDCRALPDLIERVRALPNNDRSDMVLYRVLDGMVDSYSAAPRQHQRPHRRNRGHGDRTARSADAAEHLRSQAGADRVASRSDQHAGCRRAPAADASRVHPRQTCSPSCATCTTTWRGISTWSRCSATC